jgi:HD-like signal output (HDOD) protein
MSSAFEILKNSNTLIPSLPPLLDNLRSVLTDKVTDCSVLVSLIDSDQELSMQLKGHMQGFHLSNNTRVFDTKTIILMLGTEKLFSLVSFYSLKKHFATSAWVDNNYWLQAPRIARCMLSVNDKIGLLPIEQEHWLYGFGLLKDVGMPLMAFSHDRYLETLSSEKVSGSALLREEERLFHSNHALIGYQWAKAWKMPIFLSSLILNHHDERVLSSEVIEPTMMQRVYIVSMITHQVLSQYQYKSDYCEWAEVKPSIAKLIKKDESLLDDTIMMLMNTIDCA